mmetsp:Transcript_19492/g.14173  ORF Transcript_19492/g.14173 Transcript_19492/m.14173 type:complete len:83 (+) Transcript_19492:230-478(+)
MYFFALSQAPPPLLKNSAMRIPVLVENIRNPASTSAPNSGLFLYDPMILKITPTVIGESTESNPGLIIYLRPAAFTSATHCL